MSQRGSNSPTQIPSERLHLKELHPSGLQLEEISSTDSHPGKAHPKQSLQSNITVVVPPAQERWRYRIYRDNRSVHEILEESDDSEGLQFRARLSDGSDVNVSWHTANPLGSNGFGVAGCHIYADRFFF